MNLLERMATIARLKASGVHVIVLGTGYGAFESARASRVFGDLLPSHQHGRLGMVAVATRNGEVSWCPSHEMEIVEVDGVSVEQLLHRYISAFGPSDLSFPATSPDEIRCHPQYAAFLAEVADRGYLEDERLEVEFREWQHRRMPPAESGSGK